MTQESFSIKPTTFELFIKRNATNFLIKGDKKIWIEFPQSKFKLFELLFLEKKTSPFPIGGEPKEFQNIKIRFDPQYDVKKAKHEFYLTSKKFRTRPQGVFLILFYKRWLRKRFRVVAPLISIEVAIDWNEATEETHIYCKGCDGLYLPDEMSIEEPDLCVLCKARKEGESKVHAIFEEDSTCKN